MICFLDCAEACMLFDCSIYAQVSDLFLYDIFYDCIVHKCVRFFVSKCMVVNVEY